MKAQKNNVVNHYIKKIRPAITCRKSEKHFFLRELNDIVCTYVIDHPKATIETLYAEFGSPEQFANGILTRDDYAKMLKNAKTKTTICKRIVIAAAAVAIVAIVFWVTGDHNTLITESSITYY